MGLPSSLPNQSMLSSKTAGSGIAEVGFNVTAFVLWLSVASLLALLLYLVIRKILARLDVITFSLKKEKVMSVTAKILGTATEAEARDLLKNAKEVTIVKTTSVSPGDISGKTVPKEVFTVTLPTTVALSSIDKVEI
jgi:hypothetical protein